MWTIFTHYAIMPLFGSSKKNPAEIVKATKDALTILEQEATSSKKTEKVICIVLTFHINSGGGQWVAKNPHFSPIPHFQTGFRLYNNYSCSMKMEKTEFCNKKGIFSD